jgi:hypothetical protein
MGWGVTAEGAGVSVPIAGALLGGPYGGKTGGLTGGLTGGKLLVY